MSEKRETWLEVNDEERERGKENWDFWTWKKFSFCLSYLSVGVVFHLFHVTKNLAICDWPTTENFYITFW